MLAAQVDLPPEDELNEMMADDHLVAEHQAHPEQRISLLDIVRANLQKRGKVNFSLDIVVLKSIPVANDSLSSAHLWRDD
jgi:hypothetical protein